MDCAEKLNEFFSLLTCGIYVLFKATVPIPKLLNQRICMSFIIRAKGPFWVLELHLCVAVIPELACCTLQQ